jgi:predicted secreted protein
MGIATTLAVYATIWWTVLFAVLPLGTRSYAEMGLDPEGGDPSAPVNPNLKRKFITTSWISALILLALLALIHFHVIDLTKLPWRA